MQALIAERDKLRADLVEAGHERDGALGDVEMLHTEIGNLHRKIDALTAERDKLQEALALT